MKTNKTIIAKNLSDTHARFVKEYKEVHYTDTESRLILVANQLSVTTAALLLLLRDELE